jgi:sugar phosphate isomerase/epimerase
MLAGTAAGLLMSPSLRWLLADEKRPFQIGACDWSLGKAQDIGVFEVARKIGLDGVQVSLGIGPKLDLREEAVRQQYREAAKQYGMAICALGLSGLNRVPYSSDPQAEQWVNESIDVMVKLDVRLILLPFFFAGDIKDDAKLQDSVIQKLKKIAPQAERAGVTFALETTLDAATHCRILDAVGSPCVKVYYDVSNMIRQGYDIYKEIRQLGSGRIAQMHMKEKGTLLGEGLVDYRKVKDAIDAIGYRGWLVIEDARPKGRTLEDSYQQNLKYLRTIFPKA